MLPRCCFFISSSECSAKQRWRAASYMTFWSTGLVWHARMQPLVTLSVMLMPPWPPGRVASLSSLDSKCWCFSAVYTPLTPQRTAIFPPGSAASVFFKGLCGLFSVKIISSLEIIRRSGEDQFVCEPQGACLVWRTSFTTSQRPFQRLHIKLTAPGSLCWVTAAFLEDWLAFSTVERQARLGYTGPWDLFICWSFSNEVFLQTHLNSI